MSEDSASLYMEVHLGQGVLSISLLDNPVAKKLHQSLPVEASARLWGEEMYLCTDHAIAPGELQEVVAPGDVCWWPPRNALCFFWGPTPASLDQECRPASAVTVVGRVNEADLSLLKDIKEGDPVVVKRKKAPAPAVAAMPQSSNGSQEVP